MAQQCFEKVLKSLPESKVKGLELRFRPLGVSDEPACSVVETAFENPDHRCTPEKFTYRLTKYSKVSCGLFAVIDPHHSGPLSEIDQPTLAKLTCNDDTDAKKLALVAHAVSTIGKSPVVTDADMAYPQDWPNAKTNGTSHTEHGRIRTICLHSLAILPQFQGFGLGPLLMKTYVRYIEESKLADRVALLCEDRLIPFYQKLGFELLGPSDAQFGGGGWYDMVLEYNKEEVTA